MKRQHIANETRRAILGAAAQIVSAQGSDALTLEAVARVAGVSKGGLLYHFPGKEALIVGMVEHLLDEFDTAIQHELAAEAAGQAGRWTRAFVRATFLPEQQQRDTSAALLAAVAANPELLAPMRARYESWQAQIDADGLGPARGLMVRLALDGLWFSDLLGFAPPDPAQRALLRNLIDRLTSAQHNSL